MADTYTCEHCGGTFEKGWSDEESAAEAASVWGDLSGEDVAIICDDCWQLTRPDRQPTNLDLRAQWENARRAWAEHSGRRPPPFKTSDDIIREAVDAVLRGE